MGNLKGNECSNYQRTKMQKDIVIQKLKEEGYRITKQRRIILDIILGNDCSCCKEIYYKASLLDKGIGVATVYRMVSVLEEIGAISRKITNQAFCGPDCKEDRFCVVQFDNNTTLELSTQEWERIMQQGLLACGYTKHCNVENIMLSFS